MSPLLFQSQSGQPYSVVVCVILNKHLTEFGPAAVPVGGVPALGVVCLGGVCPGGMSAQWECLPLLWTE